MRINELRIGNQVARRNGMEFEIALKDFQSSFFEEAIADGNIVSIPMTHELALQLGFINDLLLISISGELFLHYVEGEGVYIEGDADEILTDLPLNTVHEIQNLYFSLTRRELQIRKNPA